MNRSVFALFLFVGAALPAQQRPAQQGRPAATAAQRPIFDVVEATIPQMQAALTEGRVTSRELVLLHMARIAQYEEQINAVITVSKTALAEADALDAERAAGRVRGPLHGIPVALKDNVHTTNMPTTGGALAFKDLVPPYEATLTKNLKDAGAIIIAKTVMTELANWVAGAPDPMPGNYSAVGGQGLNPYDPRTDPRPGSNDGRAVMGTGGSSSGIGTAASFWAANVGTETSGSILSPSNANMLAGIKPTVGRVSRWGVIPITADQDTPGPMARTVEDAAIMLGALEGRAPDPNDPDTRKCTPPANNDYRAFLKLDGLKGARIGIPRANYFESFTVPGTTQRRGGLNAAQTAVMNEAIAALKAAGAVIVDPANIPSVVTPDTLKNFLYWGVCAGSDNRKGQNANCSIDFAYGMKRDFNAWLTSLGSAAPFQTLTDLRWFNITNADKGAMKYGQSRLDISDEIDLVADKARYDADRAKDIELGGPSGIDAVMKSERLDALLFPGAGGAGIAAKPGYPTAIVPFGMVPNAPTPGFPSGFDAKPTPFGVSFTGGECSEPRLIELAYAFEQATKKRVAPKLP
ncbi:MAG: amidase family protein [Gemmatimonadetes bacterium]|nr:amidase family protein [Gemmatimonadota bacterium]